MHTVSMHFPAPHQHLLCTCYVTGTVLWCCSVGEISCVSPSAFQISHTEQWEYIMYANHCITK